MDHLPTDRSCAVVAILKKPIDWIGFPLKIVEMTAMASENRLVKVFVKLEKDEEGYPPVDWEELWAASLGDCRYRIDNIPFYAVGISSGDSVIAASRDNKLVVTEVVGTEGHSTVRVVVHDKSMTEHIRGELKIAGCATELSNVPGFFSVDVPPQVDYPAIARLLRGYEEQERIGYEESALRHDET